VDLDTMLKIIQSLGFPAAMALGFLYCFYKLGVLLISFLTRVHEAHERERSQWYDGLNKTVNSAMQYQREEHIEIMGILKSINKSV